MTKNTSTKKFCPKCDRFWPRDNFYKNKALPDGLTGYCKEHMKALNKALKKSDPEYFSKTNSASKRANRFNMTKEEFENMLKEQNNKCAICQNDLNDKFNIDHDHSCCDGRYSCGECVRGILCGNCNRGLGQFKDNIEFLKSAIAYLQKSQ